MNHFTAQVRAAVSVLVLFAAAAGMYAYLTAGRVFAANVRPVVTMDTDRMCVDTNEGARTNPHKMLFLSCGGFLE